MDNVGGISLDCTSVDAREMYRDIIILQRVLDIIHSSPCLERQFVYNDEDGTSRNIQV